ncbi:hypothetical protein LXA43DRAFT_950185 [Ganoderma leucocontextum]|nr:hypothetical protein LXA43DRAFT_950185 [Ganoderma leucocontextum]
MAPSASAVACHDILAAIFAPGRSTLGDTRNITELRQSYRAALVSSAVACRTLSHYALDVLWRELDHIYPLLKILPNYKNIDLQSMFCGAILPEHWTRFQLYADRVRTMGHPPREGVIHKSVWLLLATRCSGSPLIPRLRKLVASELRVSETSALFLLVSPTLRVIDISFEREDE